MIPAAHYDKPEPKDDSTIIDKKSYDELLKDKRIVKRLLKRMESPCSAELFSELLKIYAEDKK